MIKYLLLCLAGTAFVLWAGGLNWLLARFERAMIYPFDSTYTAPADAGLSALAEHRLSTEDGESLVLWVKAPEPGKPVVLYFTGNAGTLAGRAHRFAEITERGYGLVAMAYRGSSGSSGKPNEVDLTKDARMVAAQIPALLPSADAGFVVMGESLGCAVAIQVALEAAPLGVILQSGFTSMRDMALRQFPQLSGRVTEHWPSVDRIAGLEAPLLVLHGDRDDLIPPEMGRALYEAAGSAQKKSVVIQGAGHNDMWRPQTTEALFAFLENL